MSEQEINVEQLLVKELDSYSKKQIHAVLELLSEGNTVPFIARYRKEATGSLDEVQIREISERHQYLTNLEKRKQEVLAAIEKQEKLTPELEAEIQRATQLQAVEDLYRPYKQKRRTKATIAKEKGLEPLADYFLTFPEENLSPKIQKYLNPEQELETEQDVLDGVHEILAERTGDDPKFRKWIRRHTYRYGKITARVKDEEADSDGIYAMYYDYEESLRSVVSHRILAMNRGEKEEILTIHIEVDEREIFDYLLDETIPELSISPAIGYVQAANEDAYKRFIQPAIEREIRSELTEKAEEQAILVFGDNLKNLLMQAPLKGQKILGFDPAFRTGCKLAAVDETGKLLGVSVIFPHPPAAKAKREAAGPELLKIIDKYDIDTIAIGNGTASRESEKFVAETLKHSSRPVNYVIVNEAGASVYSASSEARREFPDLEVEERSAVSIARRLQDPLAELVKIDPESIGVGQYQHDIAQKKLTEQLDFVVETAVNQVGVNLNTASPALLQHVSGLTKVTANNIVTYREEESLFTNRNQLKDVPRLGPKAFEQSAGFLRILDGGEAFDQTGIHPESYAAAEKILEKLNVDKADLGTAESRQVIEAANHDKIRQEIGLGKETYQDIIAALLAPGRDIRDDMPAPLLRTDVLSIEDLTPGMEMEGTVRNVVDFGAFVDIGVGQDGLVHISRLSNQYIKHPKDVVSVGDIVTVWIDSIDTKRQRIGLTMIKK